MILTGPITFVLCLTLPCSSGNEVLYVDGYQSIVRIDPSTANVVNTVPLSGFPDIYGMTYDGAKLLAIERAPAHIGDKLVAFHPADGTKVDLGPTGESWNIAALELDPSTAVLYAAHIGELFEVSSTTGAATSLGNIQGLKQFDCICGLAIDQQGSALAIGVLGYALYSLDLANLTAVHLGDLPFGTGTITDAALDCSGGLWATWSPSDFSPSGVYKIDVGSLTISHFVELSTVPTCLAFGPVTAESHYCSPKSNSIGCMPVLSSVGLASPTASSGYDVASTNVLNGTNGRLVYTTGGPASNPFAGGTLCITTPWRGTPIVKSGGSAKPTVDCSGTWTADLNTELAQQPGPQAGDTIYCQWLGRDPGFPSPDNFSLSSALAFTLLP